MAKKTEAITFKVSEKMKAEIDSYRMKANRELNQEVVLLIAEALAHRKAKPEEWL